eukprot:4856839-Pyramimonas_sp.AAC.1
MCSGTTAYEGSGEPGYSHDGPIRRRTRGYILTTDQSDAGSVGIYSHDGPIRCRSRGYILTTDQSYAGRVGIISRRTNRMQEAWVYSHDGPIICRTRGYILTTGQSDAGSVGMFSRRTNQMQDAWVYYSHDGDTWSSQLSSVHLSALPCGCRTVAHVWPLFRTSNSRTPMLKLSFSHLEQ